MSPDSVLPVVINSSRGPSLILAHGLDGVEDQVEDHLLQFDPVSLNQRQALGEFRLHRDAVLRRFATGELDNLADRCIDLHALVALAAPF